MIIYSFDNQKVAILFIIGSAVFSPAELNIIPLKTQNSSFYVRNRTQLNAPFLCFSFVIILDE